MDQGFFSLVGVGIALGVGARVGWDAGEDIPRAFGWVGGTITGLALRAFRRVLK
ncbi:hypothetical protein [Tropicimonas sp. IMCC34043]|uniref:hypothetical protein n=1 Tax=Tropicimonas sp. IMCC34043 TaxID=2248760 RepID=UPI001300766A|nr:hypothetical protein [Tropicimonas sp. IMCC34043]